MKLKKNSENTRPRGPYNNKHIDGNWVDKTETIPDTEVANKNT